MNERRQGMPQSLLVDVRQDPGAVWLMLYWPFAPPL
jgi:hypothetical protein